MVTALIYQSDRKSMTSELAWYRRYEASRSVSFRIMRYVVPASHEIRTVGTACLSLNISIQEYWLFLQCKL
ncbi:hypothetical protein OCI57_04810 [Bacteroides xylanisolvens]|uniref:hypothetical protein n=1 Tax=Bacteroides xylanisolvens TaxID=371601 RepID=UPI003832C533